MGVTSNFRKIKFAVGNRHLTAVIMKIQKAAKHTIETFADAEYVVLPSGSCAAMLLEYKELFADDPEWEKRAEELASKTYELTQFLVHVLKVEDIGAVAIKSDIPYVVPYVAVIKETEAPFSLLEQVKGLELAPLANKESCCGFGGTFSVKMPTISEQMVEEKVGHIEATGADLLIGADCGCLMNIGGRIERNGKAIEVKHIAQVLNSKE